MNCYIAYLLSGSAEKRHNELTKEIECKFGLVRKNPPHVTLKRPFETDSVGEVGALLGEFAGAHKKAKIFFKGFGHFEKEVIYADVRPSAEASSLILDLDLALKDVPGLLPGEFEKNRKLHSTLADKGNIKEIFSELWDFTTLGSFDFEVWLDNISIMMKRKGKWEVYKKYGLK